MRMAYPQPLARTCCCQLGPPPAGPPPPLFLPPGSGGDTEGGAAPRPAAFFVSSPALVAGPPAGRRTGPPPPKPNSIITGTGPLASAGVVNVSCISTVISGYDELSTWPTSFFVTTAVSPTLSLFVSVTSHFTLGVSLGTRP